MSRKATIRSKTEERKRRRDLVRTLAILPHDVTFLTERYEALKRDPARPTDARFCLLVPLDPQKFDFGFASAQDDRLQVMLWFADSSSTAAAVPLLPQEKALVCALL